MTTLPRYNAMSKDLQTIKDKLCKVQRELLMTDRGRSLQRQEGCPNILESRPLSVGELCMACEKWVLSLDIPPVFKTPESRRWFLSKCMEQSTSAVQRVVPTAAYFLPDSLRFWQPPDACNRLLFIGRIELESLFTHQIALSPASRLPSRDDLRNDGSFTLFVVPGHEKIVLGDASVILKRLAPQAHLLLTEYAEMLARMYNMSIGSFNAGTHMYIRRVSTHKGTHLCLHEMSKFNRGPVIHTVIGKETFCMDMTPSLCSDPQLTPMRIELAEGTLVVWDGDSRMRYAYSLPEDGAGRHEEHYFLVTFEMDYQINSVVTGQVAELYTECLETPICTEHVVSGRPLRNLDEFPVFAADSCSILAYNIHSMLQSLHSHLLTADHKRVREEA